MEELKYYDMKQIYLLIIFLLLTCIQVFAEKTLVILHTNDTHSQLEPYTEEDRRNAGQAGIVRREALYRTIRAEEPNVLVFDIGDFVQGTPYFNFFKGDAEVGLMNYLKIDALTLGNHEFDNGIDFLVRMLKKATFPIVSTNYDLSATRLKRLVKPWIIIKKDGMRIGIVSANINPVGLITPKNYEGMVWLDPIKTAEKRAAWLKEKKKCDIVICLSHLGYKYQDNTPDDLKLAAGSKNIDVILGGHTHTFMKEPAIVNNLDGKPVIINQVGKGGILVGKLKLSVE